MTVHPGRLLDLIDALEYVDLASRDEVYYACRALLVHGPEQIAIFDRAFEVFWKAHDASRDRSRSAHGERARPAATRERGELAEAARSLATLITSGDEATSPDGTLKIWSDAGGLADKDFAALTADELADASAALARLVWKPGERKTRRWVRGRGPRLDLRR